MTNQSKTYYIVKILAEKRDYEFETKSEAYEFATGLSLSTNWDMLKVDNTTKTKEVIGKHRYE